MLIIGSYQCTANNTEGRVGATIIVIGEYYCREGVDEEATTTTEDTILQTEKTVDTGSDTPAVINNAGGDHKLLKHILHKMNKFEVMNSDMVKAMKESNRYLNQILRNQKVLLEMNSTNILL